MNGTSVLRPPLFLLSVWAMVWTQHGDTYIGLRQQCSFLHATKLRVSSMGMQMIAVHVPSSECKLSVFVHRPWEFRLSVLPNALILATSYSCWQALTTRPDYSLHSSTLYLPSAGSSAAPCNTAIQLPVGTHWLYWGRPVLPRR